MVTTRKVSEDRNDISNKRRRLLVASQDPTSSSSSACDPDESDIGRQRAGSSNSGVTIGRRMVPVALSYPETKSKLQEKHNEEQQATSGGSLTKKGSDGIGCEEILRHLTNIDHDSLSILLSWIQQYGEPVIKDFIDLGGVLRLLVYLKHHEDDPKSVRYIVKILADCLESINSTDTDRRSHERIIDLHLISRKTAAMIVERNGIESLFRAMNRSECIRVRYRISRIFNLVSQTFTTENAISANVNVSLLKSAESTLIFILKRFINDTKETNHYWHLIEQVFGTLYRIVEHTPTKTEIDFFGDHTMILSSYVDVVKNMRGNSYYRGIPIEVTYNNAKKYFGAFFERFQLATPRRFGFFEKFHEILPVFVFLIKEKPGDTENIQMVQIFERIYLEGLATKSFLIQKLGIATALSAVLESTLAGDESKKRAGIFLKSLL